MALIKVASTDDLKPNQMKAIDTEGKPILLVNLNGTFYAIGNKCTHRGCLLSNGTLNGDTVKCGCHGATFDVKTGNVVKGPAKNAEPKYEVRIDGGQVMISI